MRQTPKFRIGAGLAAAVLLATVLAVTLQAQVAYLTKVVLNAACTIQSGAGSPNSSVTGSICDLYLRTDGGAATTFYVKESGTATNTGWVSIGGSHVEKLNLPAAICDHGTAASVWSTAGNTGAYPSDNCDSGTNTVFGDLAFADSGTQTAQFWFRLPSDWTSTVDLSIVWYTSATTGSVVFAVSTACSSVGDTLDPTFNAAQSLSDAAQGSTGRMNTADQVGLTMTGCVAGDIVFVRVQRDPTVGGDTISATADVVGAEVTLRRTF